MDSSLYKRQIVQQHNPKDYYRSLDILSREVSEQFSEETEKRPFLSTFLFCSNFASISPRISHSKYIPMIPRKDILLEMHRNTAPNNQQPRKGNRRRYEMCFVFSLDTRRYRGFLTSKGRTDGGALRFGF